MLGFEVQFLPASDFEGSFGGNKTKSENRYPQAVRSKLIIATCLKSDVAQGKSGGLIQFGLVWFVLEGWKSLSWGEVAKW